LVVLAVQDRLRLRADVRSAMAALFAGTESSVSVQAAAARPDRSKRASHGKAPEDVNALIAGAARIVRLSGTHGGGKAGRCWTEVGGLERKLEALQRRR